MTIYMKVTRDKYSLPVAVADSAKELAALALMVWAERKINKNRKENEDGTV